MPPAANTNTGKKDSKGRIIWMGPRGGMFVRSSGGKKLPIATNSSFTGFLNLPANLQRAVMNKLPAGNLARLGTAGKTVRNAAGMSSNKIVALEKGIEQAMKRAVAADASQKVTVQPYVITTTRPSGIVPFFYDVFVELPGEWRVGYTVWEPDRRRPGRPVVSRTTLERRGKKTYVITKFTPSERAEIRAIERIVRKFSMLS
jgi:hypothetical protein